MKKCSDTSNKSTRSPVHNSFWYGLLQQERGTRNLNSVRIVVFLLLSVSLFPERCSEGSFSKIKVVLQRSFFTDLFVSDFYRSIYYLLLELYRSSPCLKKKLHDFSLRTFSMMYTILAFSVFKPKVMITFYM